MVRTPHLHCRGHRFDPCGTKILHASRSSQNKKREGGFRQIPETNSNSTSEVPIVGS